MLLTSFLILFGPAWAQNSTQLSSASLRSEKALNLVWTTGASSKDKNLTASLTNGFHFNSKAPNGIQLASGFQPPTDLEPHKLFFKAVPPTNGAIARFYVCDDHETFCEIQSIPLQGQQSFGPVAKAKLSSQKNDEGFYVDNYPLSINLAQKQHQLVLIDFGARWCPACLRLQQDVFADKQFKNLSQKWILLKMDVDQFENQPILEQYKIHEYPTMVFVNESGSEVLRVTDFLPLDRWTQLRDELNKDPRSLAELAKDPNGKEILAKRYAQAGDLTHWLELYPQKPAESMDPDHVWLEAKFESLLSALQKKSGNLADSDIQPLRLLINEEPETTRSLRLRKELLETLKPHTELPATTATLWQETKDLSQKLLHDPELLKKALLHDNPGEFIGYEKFYVAFMMGEVSDSTQSSASTWTQAYEIGKASNIKTQELGPNIRLFSSAFGAHHYQEALLLINRLLKIHPQMGDLERRKLKTLVALKRYKEAVVVGRHALSKSYGLNEFMVVEPLGKAMILNGQKQLANELIQTYLKRPEIELPVALRMKQGLTQLLSQTVTN